MFRLKLETDKRWVNIVEQNIPEILTDHAWCEQKAASNAISMVVHYPHLPDLTTAMLDLAKEELSHFERVHEIILKRGYALGRERKDDYVNQLHKIARKGQGPEITLLDKLLVAAMIEARSCERFKTLSENIRDEELAAFYHELMISEANHYTLFINFARKLCPNQDVDARWKEFIDYEGEIIRNYGTQETIHG
jgi:tRNA 2-(methylsulfanyl)-N6-isopentenyladenosine37 hydroxylase